jgi:hypothetical protein
LYVLVLQILFGVRSESAVGIRTKAMRCLTQVIEADHAVLLIVSVLEAGLILYMYFSARSAKHGAGADDGSECVGARGNHRVSGQVLDREAGLDSRLLQDVLREDIGKYLHMWSIKENYLGSKSLRKKLVKKNLLRKTVDSIK